MKNTKKIFLTGARAAFFGAVALGAASAMAWTAAPANPPANNVAAPLNISNTAQTKNGNLTTSNAGYYVELSRGDSWSTVTNGNVYASDVYSSAAGKWLSDTGTFLGVAISNTMPNFTATVPAGATYAIVSIYGTVHGGGGDQSIASGEIYIDLVGRKSTGGYVYTVDTGAVNWSGVSFGTAIPITSGRGAYNTTVNLTGSTLSFNVPGENGIASFKFYK